MSAQNRSLKEMILRILGIAAVANRSLARCFRQAKLSKWHGKQLWVGLAAALTAVIVILACPAVSGTRLSASRSTSITGQIIGFKGQCLNDDGDSTTKTDPVALITCNGSSQQNWTLLGDGTIRNNNRCLAVKQANLAATVEMNACNGASAELWKVQSRRMLESLGSRLCLAVSSTKAENGVRASVYRCEAGAPEYWNVPSLAVDPSGQAMPVGNIPGWRQVFADNFSENVRTGRFPAVVSKRWKAYPDGWSDTSGHGRYEPSKVVSIHNGIMDLYLHTEKGLHMVAAPVPIIPGATGENGGLIYGRYVVRFKADPIPGYKTAWLLWPDSNKSSEGEIDFPEGSLDGTFSAFVHHKGDPKVQDAFLTQTGFSTWHTAVIQWTRQSVAFYLDGRLIGATTNRAIIPDTPMHWVLQTETQLNSPPPMDSSAGNVEIDWVAVYVPQYSARVWVSRVT